MKKKLLMIAACAALAGCVSESPYDRLESWLMREDPVRSFVVPADVIYVEGRLYTKTENMADMQRHARAEVGNDRFNGLARVFSPLVATPEDVEAALKWYIKGCHEDKRPFVFIGEGAGGRLLRDYEQRNEVKLKKEGLVQSFYVDECPGNFVTDAMVAEIREAVARAQFRAVWGKDMAEGEQK